MKQEEEEDDDENVDQVKLRVKSTAVHVSNKLCGEKEKNKWIKKQNSPNSCFFHSIQGTVHLIHSRMYLQALILHTHHPVTAAAGTTSRAADFTPHKSNITGSNSRNKITIYCLTRTTILLSIHFLSCFFFRRPRKLEDVQRKADSLSLSHYLPLESGLQDRQGKKRDRGW